MSSTRPGTVMDLDALPPGVVAFPREQYRVTESMVVDERLNLLECSGERLDVESVSEMLGGLSLAGQALVGALGGLGPWVAGGWSHGSGFSVDARSEQLRYHRFTEVDTLAKFASALFSPTEWTEPSLPDLHEPGRAEALGRLARAKGVRWTATQGAGVAEWRVRSAAEGAGAPNPEVVAAAAQQAIRHLRANDWPSARVFWRIDPQYYLLTWSSASGQTLVIDLRPGLAPRERAEIGRLGEALFAA